MSNNRMTYAQIIAQRQHEAHERELQAKAWSAQVTEQLANEQSKFLKDFTDTEQRILGLTCKA
jgi:predicted GIY-YIG superfamily endonuclease